MILRLLRWFFKPIIEQPSIYESEITYFIENGPHLNGRESIEATFEKEEKQRHDLVAQDPQRCLEILLNLLTSPKFQSTLEHAGLYWREKIEYEITELLALCAESNPEKFIAAVVPLLSDAKARPVIIITIAGSDLRERREWLRPFFDQVHILSDDEATFMIDAIQQTSAADAEESRQILQQIRAGTPRERTEVHYQINLYLPREQN